MGLLKFEEKKRIARIPILDGWWPKKYIGNKLLLSTIQTYEYILFFF